MSKDSLFPDGLFGSEEGGSPSGKKKSSKKPADGPFFDFDSVFDSVFGKPALPSSGQHNSISHIDITASESGSHEHIEFDDTQASVDRQGKITINRRRGSTDVTSYTRRFHSTEWRFTFPSRGNKGNQIGSGDDPDDFIDVTAEDIS